MPLLLSAASRADIEQDGLEASGTVALRMKSLTLTSSRRHILTDLLPFVCTHKTCNQATNLYQTVAAWKQHEHSAHQRGWCCPLHHGVEFRDHELYLSHLATDNEEDLRYLSSPELFRAAEVSLSDDERICPFCNDGRKGLSRHIELHLLSLALFALPRATGLFDYDDEMDSVKNQGGQTNRSTDMNLSNPTIHSSDDQLFQDEDGELNSPPSPTLVKPHVSEH